MPLSVGILKGILKEGLPVSPVQMTQSLHPSPLISRTGNCYAFEDNPEPFVNP